MLGDNGGGTSTALFEGMLWARGQGAQVVSMSLGFDMAGAVAKMVQEQNYPVQFAAMLALNDYRIHYDMFRSIMEVYTSTHASKCLAPSCPATAYVFIRMYRYMIYLVWWPDLNLGVFV